MNPSAFYLKGGQGDFGAPMALQTPPLQAQLQDLGGPMPLAQGGSAFGGGQGNPLAQLLGSFLGGGTGQGIGDFGAPMALQGGGGNPLAQLLGSLGLGLSGIPDQGAPMPFQSGGGDYGGPMPFEPGTVAGSNKGGGRPRGSGNGAGPHAIY